MALQDTTIRTRIEELFDSNPRPSFRAIADVINAEFHLTHHMEIHNRYSVRLICRQHRKAMESQICLDKSEEVADDYGLDEEESTIDRFRREFGDSWNEAKAPPIREPGQHRKILAFGDTHGNPSKRLLPVIIAESPDLIVIGGDSLDCDEINPHPRPIHKKKITIKEDIACNRAFLQAVRERVPAPIDIMTGNHDKWPHRAIADAGLDWLFELYPEPLELIAEGIPDVGLVGAGLSYKLPDEAMIPFSDTPFLYPLGDAILSHMNFTSKHPGAVLPKIAEWLMEWYRPMGLPEPALVIQFHTHKSSRIEKQGGYLTLIEAGMASDPSNEAWKVEYQPKWTPGVLGMVVFEQDRDPTSGEWKTDRSSIRVIHP